MQQDFEHFRLAHNLPAQDDLIAMDPKDAARIMLREFVTVGRDAFIPSEVVGSLSDHGYGRDTTVEGVLMEGVAYLEHYALIVEDIRTYSNTGRGRRLSRQGKALANNPGQYETYITRFKDPRTLLHPTIVAESLPHFDRGPVDYDTAVFSAFKAVEVAVRDASAADSSTIGTDLMNKAFGPTGPLRDSSADKGEEEGMRHLFGGAIGVFKNPSSHRKVGLTDAKRVFNALCLASELLYMVEERKP